MGNLGGILSGLREFWEKATVLRLAGKAFLKQYCLNPAMRDELYCVTKRKSMNPRIF